MKPTVTEDEFEDAEEENKFINEVRVSSSVESTSVLNFLTVGVQDMV